MHRFGKLTPLLILTACPADDGYDERPAQPVALLGTIDAEEHPGSARLE